jgi:CBS domain-containing protein
MLDFGPHDILVRQILELATSGVSKKAIIDNLSLSGPQVGRLIAELLSSDLLRYHYTLGLLATSPKGNKFLKGAGRISSLILNAKHIARRMITLDSSKTLLDARNIMLRYSISRVVISVNSKAVGIVTEKDIAKFLYNSPPLKKLNEIALKEFIRRKLVTIDENSTIYNCTKHMLKNNISSLIVIDNQGNDKGIITKTDLVELYAYHQTANIQVNVCMQKKVQAVAPEETIHMIIMLMNMYGISRVVVKNNKKPIGIVTTRDFLPVSMRRTFNPSDRPWISRGVSIVAKRYQKFLPRGIMAIVLAQDIMSHPAITVKMNSDISEAARMMIRNRISGLPVVNNNGDLAGIITKTDILKNKFVFINRILLPLENY